MRWDSVSKRLQNLLLPICTYLGIALFVSVLPIQQGLLRNLFEKTLCAAVMLWLYRQDSRIIRWEKDDMRLSVLILSAVAGVCACIGVNELFAVTGLTELLSEDMNQMTGALYQDQIWLELLTVGLAAPLAEELLFRGILYRRMRTYLSALPAAAIAVIIFALFHGNLLQGCYAFCLGSLIIWIYEKTHCLRYAVLAHACANLISVLVSENDLIRQWVSRYDFWLCAAGLLILLGTCAGIRKRYRHS